MFNYQAFNVEIVRDVSSHPLRWPQAGEAGYGSGFGGNREYMDLRRLSWSEAIRVDRLEADFIARLESAADPKDEYYKMEEEWYEDPPDLYGLDLGVASTVVALSAARCLPFSSCNAGAFGGRYLEWYPLVAFCARPKSLDLLLECAMTSDIGLDIEESGYLVGYATDIRRVRAFGSAMLSRRADFRAIPRSKARKARPSKADLTTQQTLPAAKEVSRDSQHQSSNDIVVKTGSPRRTSR